MMGRRKKAQWKLYLDLDDNENTSQENYGMKKIVLEELIIK